MKRKTLSRLCTLLLAVCLLGGLLPPRRALAAGVTPTPSKNINAQQYSAYHAVTMKSFLYENSIGGLTRVEHFYDVDDGLKVIVEDYDSQFRVQASRTIPRELPVWGGFFAGKDYNFVIFGQENKEENDSKEVVRIVKYSRDWQRLGSASLYGANTIVPFRSTSLRCAESGGYLYIRTAHQMYTNKSDGKNHQASMMLLVRESDMKITDSSYKVGGAAYASHSFNQFILIDQENNIITLDHGDAYPRSIALDRLIAKAGQDTFTEEKYVQVASGPGWTHSYTTCEEEVEIQTFPGALGANDTGCSLGGFAETSNGYAAAYAYDGVGKRYDPRDIYFAFVGKNKNLSFKISRLTTGVSASTPQLASTGLDGGYILWNQNEVRYTPMGGSYTEMGNTLYYARYGANGTVGAVKTASAPLSDCAPVYWNGKAVWYVTNDSVPVFYTLDSSGVTAHTAAAGTGTPAANTAYSRTQTVLLDGKAVEFRTYALKDSRGNETNYVRLRDLACYLNGTRAQFAVGWDQRGIYLSTGRAYTPNGSELSTPFSGDRPYTARTDQTLINGTSRGIASITLTDSGGGAYTYYQLRDMGRSLGFNVSFINGQVVINTNEPYSDAQ